MTDPHETIEIQNVVASTSIGQELDLAALADDLQGSDYDPEEFPGLIYRLNEPKASCLIFRSGKIVCTGTKREKDVKVAIDHVVDEFRTLGIPIAESPEIVVANIVSTADLDRQLDLSAIAIALGLENIEYEPEQFPGLVYRLDDPEIVVLLFGSGKLVITGGTQSTDAASALEAVSARLAEFDL